MVRTWRKNEDILTRMKKTKCAMRSGSAQWPNLEKSVAEWIAEHRQNGYVVTRNTIRKEAMKWANTNKEESRDFKATASWCSNFLKRHDFVLRQKTKIAQRLPSDLNSKQTSFHSYVISQRKQKNYALSNIGNMDETPLNFDMVGNYTVDVKGTKSVL
ncbi:hypothetical protein Pcinc_010846 [Petrolisthes cinctipes]|uniref:HTH CENPB-type domain-containing protein n=1 Tax=Petrolisthes cinctipes TaxID=88211 RepID=A0AAE1KT69_PETCI|nr:hypothetical protein Pcinc_010846 [Petrolisthes cinctipes]